MHRPVALALVLLAPASAPTVAARPAQQPKGDAAIVGTVVDEHHQPVVRAQVQAFAIAEVRRASEGRTRPGRSSGYAYTDASGGFRLADLPAGDYVIAAEAMPAYPGGQVPSRFYGPSFHPATLDVSQATPVRAATPVGAPVQIALVPVTPVRVGGTVASASGRSTAGLDVLLFRSFGGFGGGGPVATVDERGTFEIPRVPPGVYVLRIEAHGSQPGEDGREFVERMLDVTDRDLDLSVTVSAGASLTGRVVATPAQAIRPVGLRITASPVRADELLGPPAGIDAAVNADWSFRIVGLSGPYRFSARSDRAPLLIAATRIVVDGTAYAADATVTFTEGPHDVVVYVEPREAAKPAVDATQPVAVLLEQFRNEKLFWKQFEIGKAIADRRDTGVLPGLEGWLRHDDRHVRGNVAFIFARLGDPRGLQTIADILSDRTERPQGQGIPTVSSDGRYHFERQVATDRYYAAHLLGDLRDARGVELLVPLLDDRDTQSIVPWSLEQIGERRAIAPLIAALDNDDPSMRVLVIYALEGLQAKEAVPRLQVLLNDRRRSRFGALVTVAEAAKAAIEKLR